METPIRHKVVLFLDRNARVIYTDDIDPYKDVPGVLIDPDFSAVEGCPPHHWKNEKGKVVQHDSQSKWARDHLGSVRFDHEELAKFFIQVKKELRMRQVLYAAGTTLVGALSLWYALR